MSTQRVPVRRYSAVIDRGDVLNEGTWSAGVLGRNHYAKRPPRLTPPSGLSVALRTLGIPGCHVGLVVFLGATSAMTVGFALAVVGHGRNPGAGVEGDNGDYS